MLYTEHVITEMARALAPLLPGWGLPPDSPLDLLTVSENATWLAGTPEARVVLRVQRPDYNSDAAIASELAWIRALRRDAVLETPAPVPLQDGRALTSFVAAGITWRVAAFSFAPGSAPPEQGNLSYWFEQLGEITARLHQFSRSWTLPDGFTRRAWTFDAICGPDADWGDWRAGPGLDAADIGMLSRVEADLRARCAAFDRPDRRGLCHGDMRMANLLVAGRKMSVIDFDDCGFGWYAADFAASTSFMDPEEIWPLLPPWLEGYRRIAPFGAAEEAMLPALVMLRRLQLVGWIASHSEAPEPRAMGPAFTRRSVEMGAQWLKEARI